MSMLATLACGDGGGSSPDDDALALTGSPACDVQTIVQTRCASCHGKVGTPAGGVSLMSLSDLRITSALDPQATLAERALTRMANDEAPMPPAPHPRVPASERAIVQAWHTANMPNCATAAPALNPAETSPNQIPQAELFTCNGAPGASPPRLHRIDKQRFRYSVPSQNGIYGQSAWAAFNPFETSPGNRYSTYAEGETIDEAMVEMLLAPGMLGERVGRDMLKHLRVLAFQPGVTIGCMFAEAPTTSCQRDFAQVLLTRLVLFRPPTNAELDRLAAFAATLLASEGTYTPATRAASLEQLASSAWLMSSALFHAEIGATSDGTRRRLSNWELADQLTRLLGYRQPGAPRQAASGGTFTAGMAGHFPDIVAAAQEGTIQRPEVIRSLLRAHAMGVDPERHDLAPDSGYVASRATHGEYWIAQSLTGFFREWLGYDKLPLLTKDQPAKTSQFQRSENLPRSANLTGSFEQLQNGLYAISRPTDAPGTSFKESTLVEQLDDVIARVVNGDREVLRTLLTTTTFHVAATFRYPSLMGHQADTQRPYNIAGDIPDTQAGRWVTLPANERAGVLTHPAWLAAHGGTFEDDPSMINRGRWIRENLLCQDVPPLSEVRVAAVVGPSSPTKSARNRVEEATASAACQGCHALMNSLGAPFEIYNHAGYLRAVDHAGALETPPDGSAVLTNLPEPALNGPVANATELMHKLADSPHAKRCFIRQAFRYYMGRAETRADACSLRQMETAYDESGSMVTMLQALATSDAFLYRTQETSP